MEYSIDGRIVDNKRDITIIDKRKLTRICVGTPFDEAAFITLGEIS